MSTIDTSKPDTSKPSRRLDAWIGERLMGWAPGMYACYCEQEEQHGVGKTAFDEWFDDEGVWHPATLPCYSTDIAAAWQIIDHFGGSWNLATRQDGRVCSHASVFRPSSPYASDNVAHGITVWKPGKMPLAICLVALDAADAAAKARSTI